MEITRVHEWVRHAAEPGNGYLTRVAKALLRVVGDATLDRARKFEKIGRRYHTDLQLLLSPEGQAILLSLT